MFPIVHLHKNNLFFKTKMKCFSFAAYTLNIIQINFTKPSNHLFYQSQLRVVSPCTRKYETHNAWCVACVLHHLN
jgi:hypothetical protein